MRTIKQFDKDGGTLAAIELDEASLEFARGDQAVHDVIVAQQAAKRAGTASTLSKGNVAGSGRKPWRQKGTGRARAGYRQSPVWRGGGVAFGPHPRQYQKKINRKVAGLALRRAFALRVQQDAVRVIEDFAPDAPKTAWLAGLLKRLGIDRSCLILSQPVDPMLIRMARNIPSVALSSADMVDVTAMMRFRSILMTRAAYEALQTRLARPAVTEQEA